MTQTLDEMLRLPRVCQVTGKSARQIYREIKAAKFPKPVKDGSRSSWLASEIAEWQRARIAERDTALSVAFPAGKASIAPAIKRR